jgi:hypothetical protein
MVGRKFFLRILVSSFLIASCTSPRKSQGWGRHVLCRAALGTRNDAIVTELAELGFKVFGGFSSVGMTELIIEGSWEDAYQAREVIRRLSPERKWQVSWRADCIAVPGTDTYRRWKSDTSSTELPVWIRVASVELGTTSSKRILDLLLELNFEATPEFGEKVDFILVRRGEATKAVERLSKEPPLPGVTIHPHRAEEY